MRDSVSGLERTFSFRITSHSNQATSAAAGEMPLRTLWFTPAGLPVEGEPTGGIYIRREIYPGGRVEATTVVIRR